MDNTEKIQMTINIGGCQLPLTVPFSQQDLVREVEAEVSDLYTKWRRQFTKRSDREILAMVAYQYASFYRELNRRFDRAGEKTRQCLDLLDGMENPQESEPQDPTTEDSQSV